MLFGPITSTFPPHPTSAGRARAIGRGALDGYDEAVLDDIVLMVSELVTNAMQHSRAGGGVSLGAVTSTDAVQVRVMDQGPGIALDDLPHVFERFYRADRARGAEENGARRGSGIGLTIARELVTANGGRISVERTGATGTTFLIELRRA